MKEIILVRNIENDIGYTAVKDCAQPVDRPGADPAPPADGIKCPGREMIPAQQLVLRESFCGQGAPERSVGDHKTFSFLLWDDMNGVVPVSGPADAGRILTGPV